MNDRDRYERTPDGQVYSVLGGYYIDADLWEQRMRENRSPRADHDFQIGDYLPEEGIPREWGRAPAVCQRCGEKRLVWERVSMRDLNLMWCVDRSLNGRWRRLRGRPPVDLAEAVDA